MFYSQDILCRRGGKFGIIWCAATNSVKLTRREVASVCLISSCDDILKYILLRANPVLPGGARPRLSLYLSSLLMFGVVKVYSKQQEFLLTDATTELLKVRSALACLNTIDLSAPVRGELVTMPEKLYEEGDMDVCDLELDFDFLADIPSGQEKFWRLDTTTSLSSASLPQSPQSGSSRSRREPFQVQHLLGSPTTVASLDEITLKEPDRVRGPDSYLHVEIPIEEDLLLRDQDRAVMMEMLDEPRLRVEDLLPSSTPLHPRDGLPTDVRHSFIPSPITAQTEQARTPQRPPPEEVPEPRPRVQSPGITQPIITSPLPQRLQAPSFALPPVTPSPGRQRRKRQLVFADVETQIPMTQMKQGLKQGQDTCRRMLIPAPNLPDAEQLMRIPVKKGMRSSTFLPLWQRNARTATGLTEEDLDEQYRQQPLILNGQTSPAPPVITETRPSPVAVPEKRTPRKRRTTDDSLEHLRDATLTPQAKLAETSLPDQQMDASVSRGSRLENLDNTLEELQDSRKDKSQSKRRRTRSQAGSSTTEDDQASLLQAEQSKQAAESSRLLFNIQEETQIPEIQFNQEEQNIIPDYESARQLQSRIHRELAGNDYTMFSRLCPPGSADRKEAARLFHQLLGLCAENKVLVSQREVFAEIYIVES